MTDQKDNSVWSALLFTTLCIALLVAGVYGAFALAGMLSRYGVLWACIFLCVGFILCVVLVARARMHGTRHAGVMAVLSMLGVTTLMFGLAHFALYRSGSDHFAFDERMLSAQTRLVQNQTWEKLKADDCLFGGLVRLRESFVRSPGADLTNFGGSLVLGKDWKYIEVVRTVYAGEGAYYEVTDGAFRAPDGETTTIPTGSLPTSTDRQRIGLKLRQSIKSQDIVHSCDEFIGLIAREHDQWIATANARASKDVSLNVVDFIYFSITIITTVGSGDIMPNSTASRALVGLEAIWAIVIISFGIDFLCCGGAGRALQPLDLSNSTEISVVATREAPAGPARFRG